MTRSGATPGMILRTHERSSGEVSEGRGLLWVGDVRIPSKLRTESDPFGDEHQPRVAEHNPYDDERCHDGRHLFDIIESVTYREVWDGDDYLHDEEDFRARLTCVRCGSVSEWEGTRQRRRIARLIVEPLTAGDLVAQHVSGEVSAYGRDHTSWAIYRDGAVVGRMASGIGQRGRAFHQARLDAWPAGEVAEGKDPSAALRAVARHDSRTGAHA